MKSLNSLSKVTKTMKDISQARLKKTQNIVSEAGEYHNTLVQILKGFKDVKDFESKFAEKPQSGKNCVVVVGFGKGFVGPLKSSMIKSLKDFIENRLLEPEHMEGISLHKLGLKILNQAGIESKYHFSKYIDKPSKINLAPIFDLILRGFEKRKYKEINIAYTKYINSFVQKPIVERLLPFDLEEDTKEKINVRNILYEPNKKKVFENILKEYVENKIMFAVLNSNASENAARVIAMKKATDNSDALVKKLTHVYNTKRQSKITQEIMEISGGGNL